MGGAGIKKQCSDLCTEIVLITKPLESDELFCDDAIVEDDARGEHLYPELGDEEGRLLSVEVEKLARRILVREHLEVLIHHLKKQIKM